MRPFHPPHPLCLLLVILPACAATRPAVLLQDPRPFQITLDVGTSWRYLRVDNLGPVSSWVGTDTLDCSITEVLPPPAGPVVLDGLVESAEEALDRLGGLPEGAALRPHYLPPAGADSVAAAPRLLVEVHGSVARIVSRGRLTPGKYPHFIANSSGGLLDLTSWIIGYGAPPRPAYVRSDRRGDLLVPSERSGVAGWIGGRGGWFVTAVDTLISVPAGTFACVEITYRVPAYEPGADLDSYREYWAEDVGLVAWVDLRTGGDGIWVLLP